MCSELHTQRMIPMQYVVVNIIICTYVNKLYKTKVFLLCVDDLI